MLPDLRCVGILLLTLMAWLTDLPVGAATLTPERLAEADKLIRTKLATEGAPPGLAIAILAGAHPVATMSYGTANLEQSTPVDVESIFPVASITKVFTALAILQLEQAGRLSTEDALSRFLPNFPNAAQITLSDLLVHTSGIAEFTDIPTFADHQERDWKPDELIAMVAAAPPLHAPRQVCLYSDSGYILLGRIVELASGQPFMEYVKERVAQPLAMPSVAAGTHRDLVPHRVDGYVQDGSGWINAPYVSLQAPWAAGGLTARVDDLVRLAPALKADGPLLQPASYAKMVAPVVLAGGKACRLDLPGANATYGYGLEIVHFDDLPDHRAIGKSGVFPGYGGYFAAFEGSDLAVAALANADGSLPFTVEAVHDIAKLFLSGPTP
ncbi:MAG TPA: serine hydrolase domain-containing protein [Geminicoccus sp.]|jgi:CubicO group peptidase (beta-lactamase class C family)|uniref:serine hydrolase domain-containing protein n=1 Tax=Geminicoccus sp. TaxID=2024832 RepID=UPI002E37B6F7|nr:serine hydrolase domain-containing protein [Geminicoccus sp.]HEX2524921.1 serine hydrolase domain-containing protein [Geminicoccus sp.]